MRKMILSIWFLSLLYLTAGETFAQCECLAAYVNITAHNEFKLADALFIGKVIELQKSAPDQNDSYVDIVKFKVEKAWKRDLETLVTVRNKIQGCLNGFKEKEEWLVYAYDNGDGTFRTHCCCSRTKPLSKADEDLKEFEEKGEKPAKIIEATESKMKANPDNDTYPTASRRASRRELVRFQG